MFDNFFNPIYSYRILSIRYAYCVHNCRFHSFAAAILPPFFTAAQSHFDRRENPETCKVRQRQRLDAVKSRSYRIAMWRDWLQPYAVSSILAVIYGNFIQSFN